MEMQKSLTPETDALCATLFHDEGPSLSAPDGWSCPERDAAKIAALARGLEEQRNTYIKVFSHRHIAGELDIDTCRQCGLDLRNSIHIRG